MISGTEIILRMGLLFSYFAVAYVLGDWRGVLLGALIAVLGLFSAIILAYATRGKRGWSRFHLFVYRMMGGISTPYTLVEDGKVVLAQSLPRLFDWYPRILVVTPGNAVVIDKVGGLARVIGSGMAFLEPYERVRSVVDLRSQVTSLELVSVPTRDRVLLDIHATLFYRIKSTLDQAVSTPTDYPFSPDAVLKATLSVADWKAATETIAATLVRDVVARYTVDDLFGRGFEVNSTRVTPANLIENELQGLLEISLAYWGVTAERVVIEYIRPPQEVVQAWSKAFKAEAKAEAEAGRMALRYIEVLERLASDEKVKRLMPEPDATILSRVENVAEKRKDAADMVLRYSVTVEELERIERNWPNWELTISSALIEQGAIQIDSLVEIPSEKKEYAMQRYLMEHSEDSLVYYETTGILELKSAEKVRAFFQEWDQIAAHVADE